MRSAAASDRRVAATGPTSWRCALCGESTYRVLVTGRADPAAPTSHGELPAPAYACTNRSHGTFFRVVACRSCGLRTLWPLPEAAAIEDAYTRVTDTSYLDIEPARRVAFTKLLRRLTAYTRPPGRLLDVGCYTGIFPWLAERAGWDVQGVEPSRWAADQARQRLPGKIFPGYLAQAPLKPESFDVVTCWDVIEHVTDPRRELAQMAAVLKPGGWLFVSTMASEALIVKMLGARWPWYMPMHLYYFTPRTLSRFVSDVGLRPERVSAYPHYTTVRYALWKLEPKLGRAGRVLSAVARRTRLEELVLKVDLGDFFMLASQKPPA